jgi:HNH endonuclease
MAVPEGLSRAVRARAQARCQYCRMHESLQGATFHIEHVIPQCKGGGSDLENLVLACPGCNLHKASKITAIDPGEWRGDPVIPPDQTTVVVTLPVQGYQIGGLTAMGRATVATLTLNHSRRQRIHEVEEAFGLYPP